jgi:hypothetical protein
LLTIEISRVERILDKSDLALRWRDPAELFVLGVVHDVEVLPMPILRASLLVLALVTGTSDAFAKDAAARGLDLFLHAPSESASGGSLPVQVRVFGFPTVSTLVPMAGARVEAVWDPESLGEGAVTVPPPVAATCDGGGRAHLDVPVPSGSGKVTLLVSARAEGHERTRTLTIERSRRYVLDLHTSDSDVVPGGTMSAWIFVRDRVTGEPAAGKTVDLTLNQGALTRSQRRLTTNPSGIVSSEIAIPQTSDPTTRWQLSARTAIGHGEEAEATTTLGVREESPQAPSLAVHWATGSAAPGSSATALVDARDGTGQGIAKLPLRYWIGARGTHAPKDDKGWLAASKAVTSDADGRVTVTTETPATIPSRGSSLSIVVKGTAEGRPLSAEATLSLVALAAELELRPELGALLPGQTQRLFVHASLDRKPIQATLALDGHGLKGKVETNARGWAAIEWKVPSEIGAHVPDRAGSDCAGEVAATVHARWLSVPAGVSTLPIERCVRVDRDAVAALRPEQPMVVAGEPLAVRILGGKGSASVVAQADAKGPWQSAWLDDVARGGSLRLPAFAQGTWTLGAAGMAIPNGKRVLGASVLVRPKVLPKVTTTLETPRASPGGNITVSVRLDDGHGNPLVGSVGAVVFDKAGGTHPEALLAMDTRHAVAADVGLKEEDIDAFLDGDSRFDIERSAALSYAAAIPAPNVDPLATVDDDLKKTFSKIVQSLEGAVYEASNDPERLRDVRIRAGNSYALNPEMLTLVTEAMDEAALTPGGESWRLADLMAVDRQVSYDTVARRVTRLKLFRLLVRLRDHLFESKLGSDEPAFRDPSALLRRLVRDETLHTEDLLDPWGHGMAFVRSSAPRIPFLSMVPGYRLVSAGPDGHFGTADDVADPFQRVLSSKTPYAEAVEEDRIVDAKWDMRVGDETIEAWNDLLEKHTAEGTDNVLGSLGGNEVGSAYGMGSIGVGGGGRGSRGIEPGSARWLAPVRTDKEGRARLVVPLGDAETMWQVVFVGVPDRGGPAVSSVEVSTALPVSVRVDSGAAWIVGDDVQVPIRLRNRTDQPVALTLQVSASGVARLVDASASKRTFSLAPQTSLEVHARVRAASVGTAVLDASVSGAGHADRIHHAWQVLPAGETYTAERTAWIDRSATVLLPEAGKDLPAEGRSYLIFERGLEPVLTAAVGSLVPDQLNGSRAHADALEVLRRVRSWAIVRGGEGHALAVRSRDLGQQIEAIVAAANDDGPLTRRAQHWAPLADPDGKAKQPHNAKQSCPSEKPLNSATSLDWLEVAPRASQGTESACWASLRAATLNRLSTEEDPQMLARSVLVFAEQPEQAAVVAALAKRLSVMAPVRVDGTVVLPSHLAGNRAARSVVLVALARYGQWAKQDLRPALWARLLTERDGNGGYGSAEATRYVIRGLLLNDAAIAPSSTIRYTELSDKGKALFQSTLDLGANRTVTVPLSAATARVRVEASSGVLVRAQRPLFRSFYRPVEDPTAPLHVDLTLPTAPAARSSADMHVTLVCDVGRRVPVVVRIPLPPGAMLAEKSEGLSQVQGAIYLRTSLESDSLPRVLSIPLRFGMAGTVTMPEVTARITDDELPVARAPARPLTIAGP